jgi:hypothetical protein
MTIKNKKGNMITATAENKEKTWISSADRSLGAKQEGLTIVHFLNKWIVSCKEAVRFPFYAENKEKTWISSFFKKIGKPVLCDDEIDDI